MKALLEQKADNSERIAKEYIETIKSCVRIGNDQMMLNALMLVWGDGVLHGIRETMKDIKEVVD